MKNRLISLLLVLTLLILVGCSSLIPSSDPNTPSNTDQQDAQLALFEFFRLLYDGDYQSAADLYAGSYEWLIEINPDTPPADHARLLEQACQFNGFLCLEVLSAEPILKVNSSEYIFQVEFQLKDGTLFVLGPCCGADETEMPPVSNFRYHVLRGEDGIWKVGDLPPYVP